LVDEGGTPVNVNKYLKEMVVFARSSKATNRLPMWESTLGGSSRSYIGGFNKGKWIQKYRAENLNYQIVDCLRKIDKKKMADAIANASHITGTVTVDDSGKATGGSGDKKDAVDLLNKLLKTKWYS